MGVGTQRFALLRGDLAGPGGGTARRHPLSARLRLAARFACVAGGLVLALGACSTAPPLREVPPEQLRAELQRRLPDVPPEEIVVPYEVGEAAVRRAQALASQRRPSQRVRALIRALSEPDGFALRYTWAVSNSAATTLEAGGGTCMGLSSLLVGLARELGLEAYYVDASRDPERHSEVEVKVVAGHIAAVVSTENGPLVVDFTGEMTSGYRYRRMSDLEAAAHYYNNMGYQLIHLAEREGRPAPWDQVSRQFARATRIAPGFARAWNNLGVASVKLGQIDRAERSYRTALRLEPGLESPRLNLAGLPTREAQVLSLAGEPGQASDAPLAPQLRDGSDVGPEQPGATAPPSEPSLP